MSNNNQSEAAMFIIVMIAVVCAVITWKIHKATGLSFDTLASVGRNLLLFFGVLGAAIFFKVAPITRYWNWILAAFWLSLIPALNEWGGGAIEEGFRNFSNIIDPRWYAQTVWQLAVAVGLAASKYIYDWVYESTQGFR